jgi:hypothetical protein
MALLAARQTPQEILPAEAGVAARSSSRQMAVVVALPTDSPLPAAGPLPEMVPEPTTRHAAQVRAYRQAPVDR